MLIRRPGQPWHPLQPALHDERALQTLLVQSPSLLPSPGPGELAVAANFRIGSTASVDLLGVGVDGRIVLVECGRQEGPGRRPMGGAALAVGAGLWRAPYEEFDRAFAVRAGVPLLDKVAAIARAGGLGWDENAFRAGVTDNLAAGRFQLILAVDVVSDEVRQVVAYLNAGARPGLASVALGLRYHAEEGVEVLIPSVFRADGGREEAESTSPRCGRHADIVHGRCARTRRGAGTGAGTVGARRHGDGFGLGSRAEGDGDVRSSHLRRFNVRQAVVDPGPGKAPASGASSPFARPADQEAEATATSPTEPLVADEADAPVVELGDDPVAEPAPAIAEPEPEPAPAPAPASRPGPAARPRPRRSGARGSTRCSPPWRSRACPAAVDAVRRLYHIARDRGRELQWGHGDHPAVTAVYDVDGKPVGVWSCYTDLKPSFVVNFEWLAPHVPIERLQRLADRLAELPSVPERLAGLAEAGYKRRLALAVNAVLAQPGAADVINSALTELIDPEAAKAAAAAASAVPPPPPGSRR